MSELTREDTIYLDTITINDVDRIDKQLKQYHDTNPDKKEVIIQVKVDLPSIIGLIGWIYKFWSFAKLMFFPDGKFRMPKWIEVGRNWKIVIGLLKNVNLLVGLWKDRDKALEKIAQSFDE